MKKKLWRTILISCIISCIGWPFLYGEGLDELAGETATAILDFFKNSEIYEIDTAVIKFENFSGYPDLVAQKYYQLLAAKLETGAKRLTGFQFKFKDIMINFSKKKGDFDLNRTGKLNYLIYLKLTGNRGKCGAGTVIYSRSLDRVVFIKYFETTIPEDERDLITATNYGFNETGFAKVLEIEAEQNLLDFKSIRSMKGRGEYRYYFYYPGKIEIYENSGEGFKKSFAFNLKWSRPYYPVRIAEGRLTYFYRDDDALMITAGNNFSQRCKVFEFKDNRWTELKGLNFVPFQLVKINVGYFLAGARYHLGENYFRGSMVFVPLRADGLKREEIVEKSVPGFYSITFAVDKQEGNLSSVHILDTDYNYRYFSADLEEKTVDSSKRGAAVCALGNQWLVVSDYSRLTDTLYFYKIESGMRELVYKSKVKGEVVFISEGNWKTENGFWVYVRIPWNRNGNYSNVPTQGDDYRLQFWRKND